MKIGKQINFFLYFLLPTVVLSQTVFYDQLELKNGLPSNVVYDLLKEEDGFLWIATEEGLIQFDGIHFKTFLYPEQNSKSGSNIKKDYLGRIWYQTFDGFLFYVESNRNLKTFPQKNNFGFVNYIIQQDYLVKTTLDGIEIRSLQNLNKLKEIKIPNFETTYLEILNDEIIFGNQSTFSYHLKNGTLKKIESSPLKNCFTVICVPHQDHLKFIAQNKEGEVDIYHYQNGVFQLVNSLHKIPPLQNVEFIDQSYWLCTKQGVIHADVNGNIIPNKATLPKDNISCIASSNQGLYWLGSLTNGIFIIKDFDTWEFTLENEKLYSITKDKNKLYFSTSTGKIYVTDLQFNTSLVWDTQDFHPIYYLQANLHPNYLFFTGNGFYVLDKNSKKIAFTNAAVKAVVKLNEQEFLTTATGFLKSFKLNPFEWNKAEWMQKIRGKSVYVDKNNHWYVATNNGIYTGKENQAKPLLYQNKPFAAKQLEGNHEEIIGLHVNGDLFEIKQNEIQFITKNRDFNLLKKINDTIYAVEKNNIYQINNKEIKKVVNVGTYLKIKDIEKMASYFFVITDEKIVRIKPNITNPAFKKKEILITETLVNGSPTVIHQKKINPNENDIQINFQFFDFENHNEYQLAYIINQKTKIIPYNSQQIKLFSLSDGIYQVKLVLIDKNSKNIIAESTEIKFEVLAPIWKRTWFILSIFIIFVILTRIIYLQKIKQWQKAKAEVIEKLTLENQLKESRLQLIKSQMNPHFFFNAINNIQSYIFTNETEEASSYLSKFSKLTRKILEFSDVSTITLKDEIEALQLYLELQQMRFKDLEFHIHVDPSLEIEKIKIPTMLIQPYVENSILHGLSHSMKEKKLQIEFQLVQNQLLCTITDNGIGRIKSAEINQQSKKPKSFATKANLERIMWLNKKEYQINIEYTDLYNEKQESLGTKVILTIDLQSWNQK
jgi:sensor histidine kinase YesM